MSTVRKLDPEIASWKPSFLLAFQEISKNQSIQIFENKKTLNYFFKYLSDKRQNKYFNSERNFNFEKNLTVLIEKFSRETE